MHGALVALLIVAFATGSIAKQSKYEDMWREAWSGADVTPNGWLIFSGLTVAPLTQIHAQGVRFRLASGYGAYSYEGLRGTPTFNATLTRMEQRAHIYGFEAQTGFLDVLGGYLWRLDPLILKAFIGGSGVGHSISPLDPENLAIGYDWGAKGVLEMWLNMGDDMWSSLDLSWSSAHETRSARGRIGYRFAKQLSFGVEGRFDIDAQGDCDIRWKESDGCKRQYRNQFGTATDVFDYSRGGVFARYEWVGGEISAAVGVSGRMLGRGVEEPDPYGSVSWITQW